MIKSLISPPTHICSVARRFAIQRVRALSLFHRSSQKSFFLSHNRRFLSSSWTGNRTQARSIPREPTAIYTMGNAPASSSTSSSVTARRSQLSSQKMQQSSSTFYAFEKEEQETPRRFGMEGLRDLGFEYRFIPCCEQHDETIVVVQEQQEGDCNNKNKAASSSSSSSLPSRYRPNQICWRCQTALYHITTGIRITSKNRPDFIPNGKRFEEVSAVCQEVIQECIMRDCSLSWEIMNPQDNGKEEEEEEEEENDASNNNNRPAKNRPPIRTLWNTSTFHDNRPTLLVITGKGLSRAGILSVRYILEQSIEVGSALFYITQALSSGMNVVLLDPNAWGADYGKDTIEISLNAILRMHSTTTTQFHILAHSAGGGYLVRYLLGHYDRVKERCRKLVFTDSTHNVQWAKHNPDLYQFLQSHSICLYVRNNSESTTDTFSKHKHSAAGEICKGDRFWKQRFGDIPTVWAGTTDHSRMCYEARTIIWDFLRSDDFNNQKIDR